MAHRIIRDRTNVEWDVWEITPAKMKQGWLAFQSKLEKRRLFPVPAGWSELDDDALVALLAQAEIVGKPKRLIE